jgi:RNA polymerase sigma-70 factor, ECF subfamily
MQNQFSAQRDLWMQPVIAFMPLRWRQWFNADRLWWFASISSRLPFGDADEDGQAFVMSALDSIEDFEQFFYRYEGKITSYLRRMLGDEFAASDLCQETFVRAWQHFTQISTYPHPETWLFRVATNLALNHLRRRGSLVANAEPILEDMAVIGGDMATQLAESEQIRQILLALAPRSRALLVLREVYGLSLDEAAQSLGMSAAAAKKMLYRARVEFRRRYLQKEGH